MGKDISRRSALSGIGMGAAMLPAAAAAATAKPQPALPAITIYHIEGRRSERVIWTMEELGLPYKLVFTNKDVMGSMAAIRAVNPVVPMAPTIFYGDQMLVESGGIVELLINRHGGGKLRPATDSPDYPTYLMWMHFSEGTLATRLAGEIAAWTVKVPAERSAMVDTYACLQFAEGFLAKHPWFGGAEFSGADIMMLWAVAMAAGNNVVDMGEFPNIVAWRVRAEARPGYKRMIAAARPNGLIGIPPPLPSHPPSNRRATFPSAPKPQ